MPNTTSNQSVGQSLSNDCNKLTERTKSDPCPHCGKPDWCYQIGELSVCKRGVEPASGWVRTSKQDREGCYFYASEKVQKAARPKQKQEFIYRDRNGQPLIKVTRSDDGEGHRRFSQSHWDGVNWVKGLNPDVKSQVPIYRYQEVQSAIAQGKPIFFVEGEGVADCLWNLGLAATTTIGGSKGYHNYGEGYKEDLKGATDLILCPDRDKPGLEYMDGVFKDFPSAKWLYAPPNNFYWGQGLPKSDGLDLKDWVSDGATVEMILAAVQERRIVVDSLTQSLNLDEISVSESAIGVESPMETLNQQAFEFFFGDRPWICVDGQLFQRDGNYYKKINDGNLIPEIAKYCNNFALWDDAKKKYTHPFAKTSHAKEVLNWAKMRLTIDPSLVNPPGLNCSNGILRVLWDDDTPIFKLLPHSPNEYFIYPGLVEYDPSASPIHCDRLLQCLEPEQREIFLRNIAAAFDIPNIRRLKGRTVKGLLPVGVGSNGKDGLRKVVEIIFGKQGMTSKTLADFQQYDEGRKFCLASLRYSRINWASENPKTTKLDGLQGLKAFITGQPLDAEKKGVDGEEFTPTAIGLWNLNELPNMQGSLQSSLDRFAPLTFPYIFKDNPDPLNKYELKADPRFVYDEIFVQDKVAPAFLNRMVQAFYELVLAGIDYSCTHEAYEQIQVENNHLFQFASDIRLGYKAGSQMTASELWQLLEPWYMDEGILTIEEGRRLWGETNRPSDRPVKAINQVLPAIHKIFPKAKLSRIAHPTGKKPIPVISGVGIVESFSSHPNTTPIPPQSPPQQTLINQDFHPTHPNFSTLQKTEKKESEVESESSGSTNKKTSTSSEIGVGGVASPLSNDSNNLNWGGIGVEIGVGETGTKVEIVVEDDMPIEEFAILPDNDLKYKTQQLLLTTTLVEVKTVTSGWSEETKNQVWELLTPDDRDRIKRIMNPFNPFNPGEVVRQVRVITDSGVATDSMGEKLEAILSNLDQEQMELVNICLVTEERNKIADARAMHQKQSNHDRTEEPAIAQLPNPSDAIAGTKSDDREMEIEDFEIGAIVKFNRAIASKESSDRIPKSVERGVVVEKTISLAVVQWDGMPIPQRHQPKDLILSQQELIVRA